MSKLENKVAVVTGGNSGIGLASAKRFAADGAQVVITGRREEAVDEAVREIGGNAVGIVADATVADDTDRLLREVRERFGRIDVLFLNAGVAPMGPFETFREEDYDHVFDTNVKAPFFTVQKALPLLSTGASVLINASAVSSKGLPGAAAYSATKAAVRSLVRTWAAELAPRGIRVNAISPGPIETPLWAKTGLPEELTSEFGENIGQLTPLGRFGRADEMASAAAFLASDDASYVTGADLQADGGFAQV